MADAMMRSNFDALRTALASSLRTVCATGRKYQRQKNREASPEIVVEDAACLCYNTVNVS
jgi:hypothetical protein